MARFYACVVEGAGCKTQTNQPNEMKENEKSVGILTRAESVTSLFYKIFAKNNGRGDAYTTL